ncbi:hypothetical protein F2Q69_00013095 [Brassica cretica]|uniref:Uncharacterized protein n=1 Tax=Brassica cretica TaxID=69181 RepID=A0A8S9R1C5_BRACR|nr:hypothetical protein F2Q69_00013095 [Brassica cretica]
MTLLVMQVSILVSHLNKSPNHVFGWMSIDVRVEVSICGSLKVSVDGYKLLSINVAHLSLWIIHSNHAGMSIRSDRARAGARSLHSDRALPKRQYDISPAFSSTLRCYLPKTVANSFHDSPPF